MGENHDITDPDLIRSFGRRRGKKLRAGRERLMAERLPGLSIQPGTPIRAQFGAEIKDIWLEIGFGGGEHLAEQARQNPTTGIVGCEPFINGVAKLLSDIDADGLDNVRIWDDDVRAILDDFPDATVARVFILFPDPWPKLRHNKRRLIQTPLLDDVARILADGAELRVASDHMDYVRWALRHLMAHPDFEWLAETPADWRIPPADWVQTRYESKALARGDKCVYLRFGRKPRA